MKFQAIFTYDLEYKGYVVEVPDLPGCFSQGKTVEEAEINVKEAIRGVLLVMERRGEPYQASEKSAFIGEVAV